MAQVTRIYKASNGRPYKIIARDNNQADQVVQMIENRLQARDPNLEGVPSGVKVTYPSKPPASAQGQRVSNLPKREPWQRFIDAAGDTMEHYSPTAFLARYAAEGLDNQVRARNPQMAEPTTPVQREREARERIALRQQGDPNRDWKDVTTSVLGSVAGGAVSDPLTMVNPGGSLVRRLGALAVAGAAGDAATQVGELHEGTRDKYDPVETLIAAGAGPALHGVVHGAKLAFDKLRPSGPAESVDAGWEEAPSETPAEPEQGSLPLEAPAPAKTPNVDEYVQNRAIAEHATDNNLDHVDVGRKYLQGNDPELTKNIDDRAEAIRQEMGPPQGAVDEPTPKWTPASEEEAAAITDEPVADKPVIAPKPAANDVATPFESEVQNRFKIFINSVPAEDRQKIWDDAYATATSDIPEGDRGNRTYADALYDQKETPYRKMSTGEVIDGVDAAEKAVNDFWESHRQRIEDEVRNERPDLLSQGEPSPAPTAPASTPVEPEQLPLPLEPQIDPEAAYRSTDAPQVEGPPAPPPPPEPPSGGSGGTGGGDDGGMFGPDTDPQHPLNRLRDAMNAARAARTATDRLRSEELSRRVARATGVRDSTSGEGGFHAELAKLKGKMPAAEKPKPLGETMSKQDVENLFDLVKNHPRLTYFETINARSGLSKLLGDTDALPTKSELRLLSEVFPHDLLDELTRDRMMGGKLGRVITNSINIPRTLMASMDFSAPGRQGIFLVGSKAYWTSFKDMFKAFGSERAYKAIADEITSRPNYPLMDKYGLSLTNTGKNLTKREEAFMSQYAEKIPIAGRLVRASDRAYSGYLNKLRADTFDRLVKDMKASGLDPKENPKAVKDIARFVNAATGRGSLGRLNQAAPLLSNVFFSPRLIASRVQLLNPRFYATLSPVVRKEALKSLLTFSGTALTIVGLAKAGGASVEADPRSSDFGKIKIGNTRYDMFGGFQQYIVAGARLITGQTKSTTDSQVRDLGKGYKADTRRDVVLKFAENKLSPVASFVDDLLRGKDAVGQPITAQNELISHFTPLVAQDIADAYKDGGIKSSLEVAGPSIFGVGVQTYAPHVKNKALDTVAKPGDPALAEVERLSPKTGPLIVSPSSSVTIDGDKQKLTPDQVAQYKKISAQYILADIQEAMKSPTWKTMSDDDKREAIKQIVRDQRANARDDLFGNGQASSSANTASAPASAAASGWTPVSSGGFSAQTSDGWTAVSSTSPELLKGNDLIEGFTAGHLQSGRRTVEGNRAVGGVSNSDHLRGDGADFVPAKGQSMTALAAQAKKYFGTAAKILNEGDHVHVSLHGLNAPYYGQRGVQ